MLEYILMGSKVQTFDATSRHAMPRHATPHHATPLHATPRHATSRHATPRHATPRHASPCHATPRHATPRHATSCHTTPRHAMPHHATPRHATPRHATPRHATLRHDTTRHAMPWYAMLICYVTPRHAIQCHAYAHTMPRHVLQCHTAPTPYHSMPRYAVPHHVMQCHALSLLVFSESDSQLQRAEIESKQYDTLKLKKKLALAHRASFLLDSFIRNYSLHSFNGLDVSMAGMLFGSGYDFGKCWHSLPGRGLDFYNVLYGKDTHSLSEQVANHIHNWKCPEFIHKYWIKKRIAIVSTTH